MKVRFLESLAGVDFDFGKGQEADLPGETALQFIKEGLAEPIGEPENKRAEKASNKAAEKAEKR